MSSLFSKLKEQATTSLQTLAKNIQHNQQQSLLLGTPVVEEETRETESPPKTNNFSSALSAKGSELMTNLAKKI